MAGENTRPSGRQQKHKRIGKRRALIVAGSIVVLAGAGIAVYAVIAQNARPKLTEAEKIQQIRTQATQDAYDGHGSAAVGALNAQAAKTSDTQAKIDLYLQTSSIYANDGKTDQAIDAATKAVALQPDNWRLYKFLGTIQESGDKHGDAITSFTKADTMITGTADYDKYHPVLQNLIATSRSRQ